LASRKFTGDARLSSLLVPTVMANINWLPVNNDGHITGNASTANVKKCYKSSAGSLLREHPRNV
jgi:hypothetical protein